MILPEVLLMRGRNRLLASRMEKKQEKTSTHDSVSHDSNGRITLFFHGSVQRLRKNFLKGALTLAQAIQLLRATFLVFERNPGPWCKIKTQTVVDRLALEMVGRPSTSRWQRRSLEGLQTNNQGVFF